MYPFTNIQLRTSLGKMSVLFSSGSGTITFDREIGDVLEGSTYGTFTYAGKTFAAITQEFEIYGTNHSYKVKRTGNLYVVRNSANNGDVGTFGYLAYDYGSVPAICYNEAADAYFLYNGPTIYASNATGNDPMYDITQNQTDGTNLGYLLAIYRRRIQNASMSYNNGTHGSVADLAIRDILGNAIIPSSDPYDDLPIGGDEPIPGGGAVGIPGFPGLTATTAGVIGLFAPSATQMQLLADFMWTDFGGTGTTVEDILKEVVEALKRSISNPLDYIIGLNIIPSQGLSVGAAKVVRFGFVSSGVSMPQLANQYFTVDCGTLSFDTVCGDTFLDYAPYSKFSIYLPYIGFKDVDPNDFVGHTIGVVYHGDCVTGGVTAYITKDGTVMYQYSGCCALNVPLSADNWGETISAAINVATGIVAAAATGGAAGLAQGALKGAASVAANPSLLSPQVSHSGAVSGGAGCMGVQFPFVIREAVNFHSTAGFNKSTGYPAYYYKKLGDVTGFTTVIDAHLSEIPMATQDEIAEIESLLESGVIL